MKSSQFKIEEETFVTVLKSSKIKNVPKIINKNSKSKNSVCMTSLPKIKTNKMSSQDALNVNPEELAKESNQFGGLFLELGWFWRNMRAFERV